MTPAVTLPAGLGRLRVSVRCPIENTAKVAGFKEEFQIQKNYVAHLPPKLRDFADRHGRSISVPYNGCIGLVAFSLLAVAALLGLWAAVIRRN